MVCTRASWRSATGASVEGIFPRGDQISEPGPLLLRVDVLIMRLVMLEALLTVPAARLADRRRSLVRRRARLVVETRMTLAHRPSEMRNARGFGPEGDEPRLHRARLSTTDKRAGGGAARRRRADERAYIALSCCGGRRASVDSRDADSLADRSANAAASSAPRRCKEVVCRQCRWCS